MNMLFKPEIEEFKQHYTERALEELNSIDEELLRDISNKVVSAIKEKRHIFAFGNGGSEAIAEHFIYALEKTISKKYQFDTYFNPKLSESTGVKNSELFNHRIERSGNQGDLVILLSASGNSENIINVSKLSKRKNIETISLTGNGVILRDKKARPNIPLVLDIDDQQILEDVSQATIHIIVEIVNRKLQNKKADIQKIKTNYISELTKGFDEILPEGLLLLSENILSAYKNNRNIRIDAPDSGALAITAGHTMHNFKWDAFQNVSNRLSNRIISGLPPYHITGVGNDGGDNFNYAIEIEDNYKAGDFLILFANDLKSKEIKSLILASQRKGMTIYQHYFNVKDEFVQSDLSQIIGHMLGRIINTLLLLDEGKIEKKQVGEQLRRDLALLRQKEKIRATLEKKYW